MLRIAFGCLSVAVALGCWLAILYLRPDAGRPGRGLRALHGSAGAGGLALLVAAAWAPLGAASWGEMFGDAGQFARSGLVLMGAGLLLGLAFWLGWRQLGRARDGVLILHAFLAIIGFVLLSGWYLGGSLPGQD